MDKLKPLRTNAIMVSPSYLLESSPSANQFPVSQPDREIDPHSAYNKLVVTHRVCSKFARSKYAEYLRIGTRSVIRVYFSLEIIEISANVDEHVMTLSMKTRKMNYGQWSNTLSP